MDGKLVDVARRGVQADDQFHDSRRETRDATMAKSPEKPRRAVSLLECPGNLRGANATLDDDGLGVEIGCKTFPGHGNARPAAIVVYGADQHP